jgi:hypothetical protein
MTKTFASIKVGDFELGGGIWEMEFLLACRREFIICSMPACWQGMVLGIYFIKPVGPLRAV